MKTLRKKGISIIEYSVLIVIVISAFFVMRNYIQRGIHGNWGKTGQSFAYGRQYDPQKTIECAFDQQSGQWYDRNCYLYADHHAACNGDASCEENIITSGVCAASSCNQLNNGASL